MNAIQREQQLSPLAFQYDEDPDDPITAWRNNMDEVNVKTFSQLHQDFDRMEADISVGEMDVFHKSEDAFFNRQDEIELSQLARRHALELDRLERSYRSSLTERVERKARKRAQDRMYKEAKARYVRIEHQQKARAQAADNRLALVEHRVRFDHMLHMIEIKHKQQRTQQATAHVRRDKAIKAMLDLEMRGVSNEIVRQEILRDFATKRTYQEAVDKVQAEQLRDVQEAEMKQRKDRFDVEAKAMKEVAQVKLQHLEEMAQLEQRHKLEMSAHKETMGDAKEKVRAMQLMAEHAIAVRSLKATHKSELVALAKSHKLAGASRARKWKDVLTSEATRAAADAAAVAATDAAVLLGSSSSGLIEGSIGGGMSKSSSRASMDDHLSRTGSVSSVAHSDTNLSQIAESEAEHRAVEEQVRKLMADEYSRAQSHLQQLQQQHKMLAIRHRDERRRLQSDQRAHIKQVEAKIRSRMDELDLVQDTERRAMRKTHEASLAELVVSLHREYVGVRAIRTSERKMLTERRTLNSILDTVADGIINILPNGEITRFNKAAENIFGYAADEVLGKNVKIITPAMHSANHDQYLANYLKTGIKKVIGIGTHSLGRKKDGLEFPIRLSVSEVRQDGAIVLFTGIVRSMAKEYAEKARAKAEQERKQVELESLIEQLDRERHLSKSLISQILPPAIAGQLMSGEPVRPKKFDDVTVLYTDLVGFTQISASTEPLQIVDLLNDLYSAFDEIIDQYDAYKVETIGDSYMVASGVPRTNGSKHVAEMAKLALHLVKAVPMIRIPGRPDVQLKMRIGIHTGPVVAGVVGRKMPRYCLFGSTVTTASKMESAGVPMKVQISDVTYRRLEEIGGFHCELRGELPIPGKGTIKTYFLKSCTGFDPQYEPPAHLREGAAVRPLSAHAVIKRSHLGLSQSSTSSLTAMGAGGEVGGAENKGGDGPGM
ncbi:adenylate and guanylate cyclase catalytic domain-domain-containing protein [Catenaria anguillulae PL171]|uniref:Adenylate and guanylate cyclase catalytic domain-domain-containing protein n=1 Tax=Catenaria anguillulae PL171 TaxID=765915 RepID=A0A1Y2I3E4_9FUNG|nr:adenylate and guanylate cyclase catalytic domain-domain-containing protein [Catenaria anguillulae PL171]